MAIARKKDLIKQKIYSGIVSGIYRKNKKVPSCRAIASQFQVSKNSAFAAYSELIALGILKSQNRSGFVVNIDIKELEINDSLLTSVPKVKKAPLSKKVIGSNLPKPEERAMQPKFWTSYPYPFVYNRIDSDLFPLDTWRICSRLSLRKKALPIWTSEAVEFDSPDLIDQLRHRLLHHRGIDVSEDEILITVGAQHALSIISTLFMEDSRPIVMEEPGYHEARHLFRLLQNNIAPVSVDADGLETEKLPEDFKLIYVTPGCHFPSMVIMSDDRRKSLLEKAQSANALIIEDDYEIGLVGHLKTAASLKSIDTDGTVIYIGSLSKSLSPSIRIGYMVAHRDIIKSAKVVRALTVRHPPSIIQETTALFLSHGYYDAHLKKIREEYSKRWHIMSKGIDKYLPMLNRGNSMGGTSFWLHGLADLDSENLAQLLYKSGVIIEPGHFFYFHGRHKNYFRIGFSSLPAEKIQTGLKLIAKNIAILNKYKSYQ